jgi:hypothetical protein
MGHGSSLNKGTNVELVLSPDNEVQLLQYHMSALTKNPLLSPSSGVPRFMGIPLSEVPFQDKRFTASVS